MIVDRQGDFTSYECGRCGAGWKALTTDVSGAACRWCLERWESEGMHRRHSLLFPEWMTWPKRYWLLDAESQRVWRQTRGVYGDFETYWQTELFKARQQGIIGGTEAAAALNRYVQWKIRLQKLEG